MKKTVHHGFTLIELLVVVAIIALLSATALVSYNGARSKAKAARVQAEMQQLKSQMELYYSSNADGYGTTSPTGDCGDAGFGASNADNGASLLITTIAKDIGLDSSFQSSNLNNSLTCIATGETWAVSAKNSFLPSGKWCVDSNGVSKSGDATSSGECS